MKPAGIPAFSLVEVVLSLGICAFVLVAMMGLFSTGLRASRESEEQVQAANLASQILASRLASPSNPSPALAIPAAALTNTFADVFGGTETYIGLDGLTTTDADAAAYRMVCRAGTNALTGPRLAQIYLLLTWPPQAAPTQASGRYETLTYVPLY